MWYCLAHGVAMVFESAWKKVRVRSHKDSSWEILFLEMSMDTGESHPGVCHVERWGWNPRHAKDIVKTDTQSLIQKTAKGKSYLHASLWVLRTQLVTGWWSSHTQGRGFFSGKWSSCYPCLLSRESWAALHGTTCLLLLFVSKAWENSMAHECRSRA